MTARSACSGCQGGNEPTVWTTMVRLPVTGSCTGASGAVTPGVSATNRGSGRKIRTPARTTGTASRPPPCAASTSHRSTAVGAAHSPADPEKPDP
ncbi:hypothetical protein [Streptomyces sp. NPDC047097]|uniref:hypothetical protein n=1 Tax=Streptomyces sp. NPDC047097 TaxID=3155260 RepID=UPI0033FDD1E5